MNDCMLEQPDKEAKADPSTQPEIRLEDDEHKIGKLTKFFQALRTAWVGALLGLGAASLGLEHDFFHSLIL